MKLKFSAKVIKKIRIALQNNIENTLIYNLPFNPDNLEEICLKTKQDTISLVYYIDYSFMVQRETNRFKIILNDKFKFISKQDYAEIKKTVKSLEKEDNGNIKNKKDKVELTEKLLTILKNY